MSQGLIAQVAQFPFSQTIFLSYLSHFPLLAAFKAISEEFVLKSLALWMFGSQDIAENNVNFAIIVAPFGAGQNFISY